MCNYLEIFGNICSAASFRVPALNLGKLTQDDDIHHIPLELDPYKYKLDTTNSASTVRYML